MQKQTLKSAPGQSESDGVERRYKGKFRNMEDLERFPVKSERPGDLCTDEGGKDARHESRVISDTDADDLDSEHGGSQEASRRSPRNSRSCRS